MTASGTLYQPAEGQPDRPRRALALLAAAGEAGMTTPELVNAAGEGDKGSRLSWYGSILRQAAGRGWVTEIGRESGGWQAGKAIRWQITDAGRARLAEYDTARATPSGRVIRQQRTQMRAALKGARAPILAEAADYVDSGLLPAQKYELARDLRTAGCTLQEIADLFGTTREWIRQVLDQGTWHARSPRRRERENAGELSELRGGAESGGAAESASPRSVDGDQVPQGRVGVAAGESGSVAGGAEGGDQP